MLREIGWLFGLMLLMASCAPRPHPILRPSLSEDETARCKQVAWTAAQSPEMWERFNPKRMTSGPVKLSERGIHYYLDQKRFDRVDLAIPSGDDGWHATYIGVTVARETYQVLDMYESFWP